MGKRRLWYAALALTAAGGISNVFAADELSPWMVRVRLLDVVTERSNDAGGGIPADSLKVSGRLQPEVDVTYFFTRNIAAELIATYPVSHTVDLNHGYIGSFQELPPTLNLQYHFDPVGRFTPYVGAGLAYMRTFNTSLVSGLGLTENNWGGDLQVGMDYQIDKHWSFNADLKKIWIDVGVTSGGSTVLNTHPDPYLVGVGVGYHF